VKVLFLVAGLVLAAQVAPAESPLVLSLEQPRGVYVLGERVPVVARAQATAQTSVQVSGPPFSAWAEDSSGLVVWRWVPPQRPGGWRKATVRLRQGGALGFAASWTPPRPGRYTVLVEFRPAGLRAKSVVLVRGKSKGVFAWASGPKPPWVVSLFSGIAGLFLGSFPGEAPACPRPGAPLRARRPVHEPAVRGPAGAGWDAAFHGQHGRCLRGRPVRGVLRHPEPGGAPSLSLPDPRGGSLCAVRLPGGVLQPEAAAFCSGVPVPGGVREEVVSES
jgi:hypothetical protein